MDKQKNFQDLLLENESLRDELHNLTQTKNQLLVYKQQLDAILDNAPVEVYLKDREGRYLRINKQFEKIFGVKNEDLVGLLPSQVFDLELADSTRDQDLSVLNSGKTEQREEMARLVSDKQLHTLLTVKFPIFNDEGEIHGLGAIATDITESKNQERKLDESRELFARTFQASPNLIALVESSTGKHFDVNDAYLSTLKFTREEIVGKTTFDFKPWADIRDRASILKKHSKDGSVRGFHAQLKARDGTLIDCSISTDPMNLDHMELVLWTITDITEQKNIEAQLRHSQHMEAVGQLTGGIAHDFNNILGIIIGNLGLLKNQVKGDKKILKRVNTIDGATLRATELVKQLLGFSRQQATDVDVHNLNQVILDMDNLIKHSITPEVEVDLQFAEYLWLTGINLGDFQDTLLNLILNARDAMPGGGQLTIKTSNNTLDKTYCAQHTDVTPGEYVHLSLQDTGIGITPEQQIKIYDPFYTTKVVGKGTGLGLSMVFGFINRSNGHIDVESEPGNGTTFHLYLPRAAGQVRPGNTTDLLPEKLPRGSETILAVDDEVELLELAKESLESLGYRVLTSTNGREALERLANHPTISLLFSDIVMPGGMNGYELADQAIQSRSDLKILLTSGHTEIAKGKRGSDTNLLTKPYSREALASRVRSLLDGSITAPG